MTKTDNISTQRNANKTKAWKANKRTVSADNVSYRASLHVQKANSGSIDGRASIQNQIDEMSKRGERK